MAAKPPTDRQKSLLSMHPSALLSQLKNVAQVSKQCCCQCVGEAYPAKAVSCHTHASQLLKEFLSQCCSMGWKCFVEATGAQCLLWALLEHGLCSVPQCLQVVDELVIPIVLGTKASNSVGQLGCRFLDAFVQSRTRSLNLSTSSALLPDVVHLFERLFQPTIAPGDVRAAEAVIILDERDEEPSRVSESNGALLSMEHILPICNDLSIGTLSALGEWAARSGVFGVTDSSGSSATINLDFVNPSPVARFLLALRPPKLFEVWSFLARNPLCRCRYSCCAGSRCPVKREEGQLLRDDLLTRRWSNFARVFLTALVRLPLWPKVLSLAIEKFARCQNADEAGGANYNGDSAEPKSAAEVCGIAPRKRLRPSAASEAIEPTVTKCGHHTAQGSSAATSMLVLLCTLPGMQSLESFTPLKALLDCLSHQKFLEDVVLIACSERPDSRLIDLDHGCARALVDLFARLQLCLWLRLSVAHAPSDSPTRVAQEFSTATQVAQFLRGAGGSSAHPACFRQRTLASFRRAVAFELMVALIDDIDPHRCHWFKVPMLLPVKAGGTSVSRQWLLSYLLKTVETDSDGVSPQELVADDTTEKRCVAAFVASGLHVLLEDFLLSPATRCQEIISRHRLVILLKVWAWPSMCGFIFQHHSLGHRISNDWRALGRLWALPQRLLLLTGGDSTIISNRNIEATFGFCPGAMKLWKSAIEEIVESRQRVVPSFLFDAIAVVLNCLGCGDDYNAACLFVALQASSRLMPVQSKPGPLFCSSSASSSASSSSTTASTSSSRSALSKKGRKNLSRKSRRAMPHNTYLKWFKSLDSGRGAFGKSVFVSLATAQPELRVAHTHLLSGGLSKSLESSRSWVFPVGGIRDRTSAQADIEGLRNNFHVQLHQVKCVNVATSECSALEQKMLLLCQNFQHVLIPNKASQKDPETPQVTAIKKSELALAFDGVLLYALLNPMRDAADNNNNEDTGLAVSSSNELHRAVFDTGLCAVQQEATDLTLALRAGNTVDSRLATDLVARFSRVVLLAGQLTSNNTEPPPYPQPSGAPLLQSQDIAAVVPLHSCLACLVSGSLFEFLEVYAQHRHRHHTASFGWYPVETSSANGTPVRVDESRSAISLFQLFEEARDMLEASTPQAPVSGDLARLHEPLSIIDQLLLWSVRNGPGAADATCAVTWGQSWLGLLGSANAATSTEPEEPSAFHFPSWRNVPMHPVAVLIRALRLFSNAECVASVIRSVHAGAYLSEGGHFFKGLLPRNVPNVLDCAWVPLFLGLCETALRASPLGQLQCHLHEAVLAAARPVTTSANDGHRDRARKPALGKRRAFGILLLRLFADLCLNAETVRQAVCGRFFRSHVVPLRNSVETLMSTCSKNVTRHCHSPSESRSATSDDAHLRRELEHALDVAGAWLSLLQALVNDGTKRLRLQKATFEGDAIATPTPTEIRRVHQMLDCGARSVLSFAKECPEDAFSAPHPNDSASQCCARLRQKASFASGLAAQLLLFATDPVMHDSSTTAATLAESESSSSAPMIGQCVQELLETGHRACTTWDLVHGDSSVCPFDSVFGAFEGRNRRCDRHQLVEPGSTAHVESPRSAPNDHCTSPTPNLLAEFCAYLHKTVRKVPQEVDTASSLVHAGAFRCCIRGLSAAFTLFFSLGGRLQKPVTGDVGGQTDDSVQCPAGLSLSKVLCCVRHLQLAISSLRQGQPLLWQMLLAAGDVEWVERTVLAYGTGTVFEAKKSSH